MMHADAVEVLLLYGRADPNRSLDTAHIPLHTACLLGDEKTASLLISFCGEVRMRDTTGRTPLMIATQRNDVSLVERLLECGAAVDAPDNDGRTPLMFAPGSKLLLKRGASVRCKDCAERGVLYFAFRRGDAEVVLELLKRGALTDGNWDTWEDGEGSTVWHALSNSFHDAAAVAIAHKLIKDADCAAILSLQNYDWRTPLGRAINRHRECKPLREYIRFLRKRGATLCGREWAQKFVWH